MRPWLHLARISNLPTVWTNVTAAWLLAGGALNDTRLAWLILAGSLLYTGGMIMNDAADAKFDMEHRKERPIPAGQVSVKSAWIVSVVMLLAGSTLAVVFGANPRVTALLVSAIVIYDLYHKQWAGSVIIMGACRVFLYLMAAGAALEPALPAALALGCYVVGITMAARLEHKNGSLPPAASLLALALLYTPGIVFALRFASAGGSPMQLLLLAAFAILIALATQTLRKGGPAIGQAVGMLLAGIVVVDALAVSSVSVTIALGFVALAPLLRVWQRWIAAT
jgi:4-hydroxybenzoate polyprenyltransferase